MQKGFSFLRHCLFSIETLQGCQIIISRTGENDRKSIYQYAIYLITGSTGTKLYRPQFLTVWLWYISNVYFTILRRQKSISGCNIFSLVTGAEGDCLSSTEALPRYCKNRQPGEPNIPAQCLVICCITWIVVGYKTALCAIIIKLIRYLFSLVIPLIVMYNQRKNLFLFV